VLFFELFPAFVLVVTIVVGIRLYLVDRRARRESTRNDDPR